MARHSSGPASDGRLLRYLTALLCRERPRPRLPPFETPKTPQLHSFSAFAFLRCIEGIFTSSSCNVNDKFSQLVGVSWTLPRAIGHALYMPTKGAIPPVARPALFKLTHYPVTG